MALLPLCLTVPEASAQFELEAAVLSETGASSEAGGITLETSGGQGVIGAASTQDADLGLGYIYAGGDRQPPVTTLLVNGSTASAANLVLVSTDSLGFFASDSEAGVLETRYSLDGSTVEVVFVSTFSLIAGLHELSFHSVDRGGNLEAVKTVSLTVLLYDVVPPMLAIAPPDASTVTSAVPLLAANYSDSGRGVDPATLLLSLDGMDITTQASVGASSATVTPFSPLSQGFHILAAQIADFAGNSTASISTFRIDSLPPITTLLINGVASSATSLVLVSTDSLGFSATDSGVGVLETRYSLDGSTAEVVVSTFNLTAGAHTLVYRSFDLAGNEETAKIVSLSIFELDEVEPALALTPANGSTVTTSVPHLSAAYSDAGRGIDPASVRLALDGLDVTALAALTSSSATFRPDAPLSQGLHTLTAQVADLAGNGAASTSTFLIDSLPPSTALLLDGLATSATNLVIISTDTLGFSAADAGTGVLETRYAIDGAAETVFASTFSFAVGAHTIAFRSVDLAGNTEPLRVVSVEVLSDDATSPTLSLAPPDGSTVTTTSPLIAASYSDLGRGVDLASVRLSLDGLDVSAQAVVTASSASFIAGTLSQGFHTIAAYIADLAGNSAASTATFRVDSVQPVTALLLNGLTALTTNLVVVSIDAFALSAADSGTGVLETRFSIDGAADAVFVSPFSLAAGTHTLAFHSLDRAGNAEAVQTVSVSVLLFDDAPPTLTFLPASGSTVATTTPQLLASYSDAGRGIDVATLRLTLDGVDVSTQAAATGASASFMPAALAQGTHTATAQVADLAGNQATVSSAFFVDSLAPVTALLVDGVAASATSYVLTSTNTLGFAAADSGTGVLETRVALDGAPETVFASTFTLGSGSHSLAFRSVDRAGNMEVSRSVSIFVPTPDTTPPLAWLDFPGDAEAIGGVVNVRGGASDASALTWVLESAPGVSPAGGFTTIASGAGNLSGLIAAWNTTSLSGYQTLRLRATDASGNTASANATVFVGSPVFNFAIGRKDSNVIVNKIKNPTGIAVRSDGNIWVASTDEDELILLTASGSVIAAVDGEFGHGNNNGNSSKGKKNGKNKDHDDDDDDDDENGGGAGFKSPQGLALDAANNLYVADKGNDRIVKLSADGSQILLQIAKLDSNGRSKAGSGPGELRRPQDMAVDGNGDIYVADSGNRRIQVFSPTGAFVRQFGPGSLPANSEVRGIALTSEGLWVSDKEHERVFLFSRAGALINSIGDADSVVGEISRIRGLASDRLGALYVVEPNRDRAQKFDPQGKGLLAFGSKAGLSHADKHAKRYLTQPIDAAVAPDGSIWLTDAGRDRIVRYALPASGGYGAASYSAGGGNVSSSSEEPVKRMVDHKDGAKVERDDGTGVSVPKGALTADLEITVEKGDENQDKEQKTAKRLEMKITAVSEEVQYGPEGTTFSAPVTLTLPYDPNLLASRGIKEENLKVYYWNEALKDWQAMPSVVDKVNKTVNAQTTHFSVYQIGALGGIGVAALDDFGIRDGYAFPNPSLNGTGVTFRMQPGSADSIEVRVYDLSGRKVHASSDFRFRGAFDDGNGKGAQNTYDHAWDVSGVGSGVYTFVMTAKKAGQSNIRKTGKVGVIR